MSPDTLLFYADRIRKFCDAQDGCRDCPFYIKGDQECNFNKNPMPQTWEIPEKGGEEDDKD